MPKAIVVASLGLLLLMADCGVWHRSVDPGWDDAQLRAELTKVKGIGTWSVDMFGKGSYELWAAAWSAPPSVPNIGCNK